MINKTLNFMYAKSIGIMGGTFDPIHYGHLMAAESVRREFNIEKIIFVPSGKPPHKDNKNVLDKHVRYIMTEMATLSNENFDVSSIEVNREGLSYTIDTIQELKKYCSPDTKIYFITGADAVETILTWKYAKELLNMCEFVAVTRPGHNKKKLTQHIANIESECKVNLHFLEVPAFFISSSEIRERVKTDKSIKYLLPEEVEKYIYKHRLYQKDSLAKSLDYNSIDVMLKADLSKERYIHTMGVAEEAVKLAKVHGEDEDKAYIASLFHDCAKEIESSRKLELCEEYGIKLDSIMKKQIALSHGLLGAEIAKKFFAITDKEVLDSIRYHTTGHKNMSKLEKIVYLADVIEPNRESTEELEAIKKIAYEDLDEAMVMCLKSSLETSISRRQMFHPWGMEALAHIEGSIAIKQNAIKNRKGDNL